MSSKAQRICQAEVFPVVVAAKRTWSKNHQSEQYCGLLTVSSVCFGLILCRNSELLLVVNAQLEVQIQALNWYSRAPSTSNPGDAPSRLEYAELDLKGHARCQPCYGLHESVGGNGGGRRKAIDASLTPQCPLEKHPASVLISYHIVLHFTAWVFGYGFDVLFGCLVCFTRLNNVVAGACRGGCARWTDY
jgi:hypothetical protein